MIIFACIIRFTHYFRKNERNFTIIKKMKYFISKNKIDLIEVKRFILLIQFKENYEFKIALSLLLPTDVLTNGQILLKEKQGNCYSSQLCQAYGVYHALSQARDVKKDNIQCQVL